MPLLIVAASGCLSTPGSLATCTSDLQCAAGQLCFAEGCGDPGSGIVVEVAGDALSGQYPRDFRIADGTLGAVHDFDLGEPLALPGALLRELTPVPDPATRLDYTAPVVLKAVGGSQLLPRTSRVYEQRVESPVDGRFQLHLGDGRYEVTAFPLDLSIPPAAASLTVGQDAGPGSLTLVFPAPEGTQAVSGRLLAAIDTSVAPALELAVTQGPMDLQAFEPDAPAPLSQRFAVSSGQPDSSGNFALTLAPRARTLRAVRFRASPRDSSTPLVTKDFLVDTPLPVPLLLDLGGPGPTLQLSGQAVDSDGLPVARAQVVIAGPVRGGGAFRSRVVTTDELGAFTLLTLESNGVVALTVAPPAGSAAAVSTLQLEVGPLPDPVVVHCGRRVRLTGRVSTPAGWPAISASVRATEHEDSASEARLLPLESAIGVTDLLGAFSVLVDPGVWRLELSAPGLPITSRLVTVPVVRDVFGNQVLDQSLGPTVRLPSGRTVSGLVTGTRSGRAAAPIPWATVRFFRVGPAGGVSRPVLLGSAVSDELGHYSVVLPGAE